jgi:sugar lactone lactonase YvrE
MTTEAAQQKSGVYAFGPLKAPIHIPRPELNHVNQGDTTQEISCGVATDSAGDLYVSDSLSKKITVYAPGGNAITSFTTTDLNGGGPCQMAVDSSDRLYVTNSNRKEVVRYLPSTFPPTPSTVYGLDTSLNGSGRLAVTPALLGGTNSVAVNPATQNPYVTAVAGNEIQEFPKPSESYKLKGKKPGSEEAFETAELASSATNTEVQTALRSALCEGGACVTVANGFPTTRWKLTFNGAATTPVTAQTDIPTLEVIKVGGNENAFEMFRGSPAPHVISFEPSGTITSVAIGSGVAGANYVGIDVYGKNGNVYVTDKAHSKALVLNPAGTGALAEFDGSESLAGAFNFSEAQSLPDIAVDQANGHAYVDDIRTHGVVDEFDGAGSFVSQISHVPPFEEELGNAITVDRGASSPNAGVVYLTAMTTEAAQQKSGVYAFGPPVFAFPLKVTKTGLGNGTITSLPAGIDCGSTCKAEFAADDLIVLRAAPASGSRFAAWSGCDNDPIAPEDECEVTMSGAREVSVHFDSRPVVSEEATSQITASSAKLEAKVNPKGKDTTYHFELISEEDWLANGESFSGAEKATQIPAAALALGNGTTAMSVGVKAEGLESSTTYRFRVVAGNDVGTAEGERDPVTDAEIEHAFTTFAPPQAFTGECPGNEALRAGPSASLPDCRAWEQASPVDKNGGSIQGTTLSSRTAEDGSTISFESTTGVPGGAGAGEFPTYMAKRGPGGWTTTGLLPDPSSGQRTSVLGWSVDFSTVFDAAELFSEGNSLLARNTADGAQEELVPHIPPPEFPEYGYVGASEDGKTVIFEAKPREPTNTSLQLTPKAAAGKPNVYALNRAEPGELHLIGVLPDGSTPPQGSQAGRGVDALDYLRDTGFVTDDGSAFFVDREDGQLYLRLNPTAEETDANDVDGNCIPDSVLACTVHISASQKENGNGPSGHDAAGPQAASLVAVSPDGSVVTFTTSEKLTDDANTGPEPDAPAIARAKASDGGEKNLGFIPAFAHEIAIDEVEGYVYWSDTANGRIGRAKLDGTDFTESYISGLGEPLGVAVVDEPTAKYIFWTERGPLDETGEPQAGAGTIGRAGLDGTGVNPTCYDNLTNPRSIAARPDFLYWTAPHVGVKVGDGDVDRADLSCNEASKSVLINDLASGDIAVDASHIYFSFTVFGNSFIRRYNLDGTAAGGGQFGDDSIVEVSGSEAPAGLALDNSHLYWTNPTTHKIGRSDLDGTDASEEPEFVPEASQAEDLATDGEHLFWTANQNLVPNSGTDLYQLNRGSGELTDLAPDSSGSTGTEVRGILGASKDGSYVYFAANGVPDGVGSSPNARDEEAEQGNCKGVGNTATGVCNLYVEHDGEVDFIVHLNADRVGKETGTGDAIDWIVSQSGQESGKQESDRAARVSADGQVLVFRSQRQLTDFDNQGPHCVEANSGDRASGPCLEFYRFDYGEMNAVCVTCNPLGATPEGPARLASVRSPNIGAPLPAATLGRNLSRDGSRFFFETTDALVAQDTNGRDGCPAWGSVPQSASSRACQDVYEWEAPGKGSCTESSPAYSTLDAGCIYLISTGKSKDASFFADADLEGNNVFVFTYEQLVGQDGDALLDAYDARVGGGLASQNKPPEPICEDESCKAPPRAPSIPQSTGSARFSGPGDPTPKRAHKKKPKKHKKAKHKRKRGAKAKQTQRTAKKSGGAGR